MRKVLLAVAATAALAAGFAAPANAARNPICVDVSLVPQYVDTSAGRVDIHGGKSFCI